MDWYLFDLVKASGETHQHPQPRPRTKAPRAPPLPDIPPFLHPQTRATTGGIHMTEPYTRKEMGWVTSCRNLVKIARVGTEGADERFGKMDDKNGNSYLPIDEMNAKSFVRKLSFISLCLDSS